MFKTVVEKEIWSVLFSPKFTGTFIVCSVLILLSIWIGIEEYRTGVKRYNSVSELNKQEMEEQTSWDRLKNRIYRKPDPGQIFVSGIHYDIGRYSDISSQAVPKLCNSLYSEETVFAFFRFIDLTFIIQVIISLLAILYTYDSVCGEKERGTLKLIFSQPVSRPVFIMAKFIGVWLVLMIPLIIPFLLSALLLLFYHIPLNFDQWLKIFSFLGSSVLYISFFIFLGLMVSSLMTKSSMSFLVSFVFWIFFVLLVPRIGLMAAGQISPVQSAAEIEAKIGLFAQSKWIEHNKNIEMKLKEREKETNCLPKNQRKQYRDDHLWKWMLQEDSLRTEILEDINQFSRKVYDEYQNQKKQQEFLALLLTRISPAVSYQLSVMNIFGMGIDLKNNFETAARNYYDLFSSYTLKKQKEDGNRNDIMIQITGEKGFSINSPKEKGKLNLKNLPKFSDPYKSFYNTLPQIFIDWVLLCLYSIIAFSGAFTSFIRFDVR